MQNALAGKAGVAVTNPDDLDRIIIASGEFSTLKSRRFIRLVDTSEGQLTICPLVYLDGNFSKKHPRLRIQLVIVTYTQSVGDKPECLLLRFETPEGADPAGIGKHDYYHSQICTYFQIDGPTNTLELPNPMLWRAQSCPAWPMDAKTPIHLLVCVVFALYGKADGVRILREAYGESAYSDEVGRGFRAKAATCSE
jgi:hypothetical protein